MKSNNQMGVGMIDPDQGGFWTSLLAVGISAWAFVSSRSDSRIRTIAKEAVRDSKEYASTESVTAIHADLRDLKDSVTRVENILLSGHRPMNPNDMMLKVKKNSNDD